MAQGATTMTWTPKPGGRAMCDGVLVAIIERLHADFWGVRPVGGLSWCEVPSSALTPPTEYDVIEAARDMYAQHWCGCTTCREMQAALARHDEVERNG